MIVMKFCGTSVKDAAAMEQVVEIVRSRAARKPAVAVSVAQGSSEHNLSLVVHEGDANKAIQCIHREFKLEKGSC